VLAAIEYQSRVRRMGADQLHSEDLCDNYYSYVAWMLGEPGDITNSKFSIDMAWFRECWWEMVRRDLVTVN
jgi:hypothetical protein